MPSRLEFELRLPDDFDEGLWATKGYFRDAELAFRNQVYRLAFYDPVRLGQDAAAEVENGDFFFEKNLVVVGLVERRNLEAAARWLVDTGQVQGLVAETLG
jgi:hypothetical protein